MSQLFYAQVPRNVLFSGYDNEAQANNGIILGSRNKSYSKLFNINGDDNLTTNEGSKLINGNSNALYGGGLISGSFNSINGQMIFISGNSNNIYANNILIIGNNNTSSSYFINKDLIINGNNNTVSGESLYINGSNNQTQDTRYNYINGNYNIIEGGLIPNNNGPTANGANPDEPIYSNNSKLYLNGDWNVVATYSNNLMVFGSYNNIGLSVSNTFIIANSQSITDSNQVYIGPDKDINIKGAVLPCNLIQDYTPTGSTDSYGNSGYVTKDDNNIYVKTTNLGWRSIPFNHTYGQFYDTTLQYNNPANTARAMTLDSTIVSANVYVTASSQIDVNYDGLYNIQYSIQIVKTDSGSDDVDIWLRYNGVDVEWSNTRFTIPGNNGKICAVSNLHQYMTASSYVEVMWSSSDPNINLYTTGTQSGPDRPAIPSVIITVDKVS